MRDIVTRMGANLRNGLDAPAARTTTAAGTGVDLQGFEGAMLYIIPGTWTDGTHTITLQEADTDVDGSYANVATTDLLAWSATSTTDFTPVRVGNAQPTAISSAATAINWRVGYLGTKRYVRAKSTITGGPSTGAVYTLILVRGRPSDSPCDV
jgi:hypothetical protein